MSAEVAGKKTELADRISSFAERLRKLRGHRVDWLKVPCEAIGQFEPSQLAVIVNTLLDVTLPLDPDLKELGISKHRTWEHDREGYPDYSVEDLDLRAELKGLFAENPAVPTKETIAKREPSARFRESGQEIDQDRDVLLVVAWTIQPDDEGFCSPTIVDYIALPAGDVAAVRDAYLVERGGKFAPDGTPLRLKLKRDGSSPDDFAVDDNFGKLNRIPHPDLQTFLKRIELGVGDITEYEP